LISLYFQGFLGTQSVLLNGIITAILVAVGFEPLKKLLSKITDKFLFKAEYNPNTLLQELGLDVISIADMGMILRSVSEKLDTAFKLDGISIYLLNQARQKFELSFTKTSFKKVPKFLDSRDTLKFWSFFEQRGEKIIIRDEAARAVEELTDKSQKEIFNKFLGLMNKFRVGAVVVLVIKGSPIGFISLGEKKSGDAFSIQDLHVLEIVSNQLSVVVENAQLYEEQKRFADVLQETVKEKTKELRFANKELKRLDKAKSEF